MKTFKSRIALAELLIFALASNVQGEIVDYHSNGQVVYYCRICHYLVHLPHTAEECEVYRGLGKGLPESWLQAGKQSLGGGSAVSGGNSVRSQAIQQGLGAALSILNDLASSLKSNASVSGLSKEEEEERQQAFDKAVADQKRLDKAIKKYQALEDQLDESGEDTLAELKAEVARLKAEQKPKLSPEEEARLNDWNKSSDDPPDKYSATNNYNQDGTATWDKNAPTRRDGESEWDYNQRKHAYYDRKQSEKEIFEKYKKEALEDQKHKEFEQQMNKEFDEHITHGDFQKATDGK